MLPVLAVELYLAPVPKPRLANPFQISHLLTPPVSAVSASKMASRAWTKLGLQGCLVQVLALVGGSRAWQGS